MKDPLNLIEIFSLNLNVTTHQIQKKLALAPVYTLPFLWILGFIVLTLKDGLDSSIFKELASIFLAYSIGVLLVYFIVTYLFIYVSQLVLIKYKCLNLWFILGSAILLTLFFSMIIFIITTLDIGLSGFNLGVIAFIGFFALSFALMYWYLLFRQHQKNATSDLP